MLNIAERNYSHLKKEALALIFGMEHILFVCKYTCMRCVCMNYTLHHNVITPAYSLKKWKWEIILLQELIMIM